MTDASQLILLLLLTNSQANIRNVSLSLTFQLSGHHFAAFTSTLSDLGNYNTLTPNITKIWTR
jgi:hypothetical protein